MRRRTATPDERKLFEEAIDTPPPLKIAKPVLPKAKKKTPKAKLDGHTSKKLKEGALDPDAKLDLHGLTQDAAHRALLNFLKGAQRRGARLVLVVTGKGKPDPDRFDMQSGGVLKNLVPRWLAEPAF